MRWSYLGRVQCALQYSRSVKPTMLNISARNLFCGSSAGFICLFFLAAPLSADGGYKHGDTKNWSDWLGDTETQFTIPFNARARSIRAAEPSLGQPAQFGQWSDVISWPLIAVHANLLPNGKVLSWDATPDDFDNDYHTTDSFITRVSVWDPVSNRHSPTINDTNGDLFCAGSAQLWDGRVLFSGGDSGTDGAVGPLSNTNIYDPITNTWSEAANMATPRWYSSIAALANGEMLTYGGAYQPSPAAEVFQFNETWRPLGIPAADADLSAYRWLQATPDGKVMSFGPRNVLETIDTGGNGVLVRGPQRDRFPERRYGSYAMYDIGKVLISGGTIKDGGAPSFTSSVIVDTATRQTTDTSDMTHGRTQHNLTILADGAVLATGGNTDGAAFISTSAGVFQPEIWSPDTGQWQPANDMQVDRQYHAIALLLPDGRVLSAGGGYCEECANSDYEEQNAEIFSPPYLFSSGDTPAIRPVITSAPTTMDYNSVYDISVRTAVEIKKIHLIKLGAVTHSQNQDQRLVPLVFSNNGSVMKVNSPRSRDIAPPGHYMLFAVDRNGVPSVSKIIKIGQPILQSGSEVNNSIRLNEVDEYVIKSSSSDRTLIVKVSGKNSSLRLSVTGDADNNSNTASCNMQSAAAFECRLSNQSATRWKIKLESGSPTPYRLMASFSTIDDPAAQQPQPNGDNGNNGTGNNGLQDVGVIQPGTGGGSAGLGFLFGLFAIVLWLPGSIWRAVVLSTRRAFFRA